MPPSPRRRKEDRFAADKVVVASLAGAAFGAILLAIAQEGSPEAVGKGVVVAAPGPDGVVTLAPGAGADSATTTTAQPTPSPAGPAKAQVPRARRSRGS